MILAYFLTALWILVLIRVVTLTGLSIRWIGNAAVETVMFALGVLWVPVKGFIRPAYLTDYCAHSAGGFAAGLDCGRGIWGWGLAIAHIWLFVALVDWWVGK